MNILVLTDEVNSNTRNIITKSKFLPLVSNTLQEASYMLKHHSFKAIVIDRSHKSIDALEFILNARELTPAIPIFIIVDENTDPTLLKITKKIISTKHVSEDQLAIHLKQIRNKKNYARQ